MCISDIFFYYMAYIFALNGGFTYNELVIFNTVQFIHLFLYSWAFYFLWSKAEQYSILY